jgi:hypothetical protein
LGPKRLVRPLYKEGQTLSGLTSLTHLQDFKAGGHEPQALIVFPCTERRGEALASVLGALGVSLSSPATIIVTVIEFLLGLGVGYVLAKGLKYVLAFFLLLIVGELLNIWSIGALNMKSLASSVTSGNVTAIEQGLRALAPFFAVIEPIFTSVVIVIGFIIGAAIAFFK